MATVNRSDLGKFRSERMNKNLIEDRVKYLLSQRQIQTTWLSATTHSAVLA